MRLGLAVVFYALQRWLLLRRPSNILLKTRLNIRLPKEELVTGDVNILANAR